MILMYHRPYVKFHKYKEVILPIIEGLTTHQERLLCKESIVIRCDKCYMSV